MDFIAPSDLKFSLHEIGAYLAHGAEQFLLEKNKSLGDVEKEISRDLMASFLDFMLKQNKNLEKTRGEVPLAPLASDPGNPNTHLRDIALSSTSLGKVLSKRTSITPMQSNKIMPMLSETSSIADFLNCPEPFLFTGNFNKDLETESKTVLRMDNIIQKYTNEEDAMITSSSGLIAGMNMKGVIPFKEFSTTFTTTKFQRGFCNRKEGDIYSISKFTARGNHSRVATRLVKYNYFCKKPSVRCAQSAERKSRSRLLLGSPQHPQRDLLPRLQLPVATNGPRNHF
ncbi:hypothetical protein TrLO_g5212 [Triparma laevis f. longispina]|uniref:Uncharacterized protein n=1 Tax=Triparma laevis f. longispina TaxID=1714387 RepID=A0A9W7A7V8_9STRA|nr:hypothetical protein TrLO_g5212 [Triparma laevis f. longispina]